MASRSGFAALLMVIGSMPAHAALSDLAELSLEELANVRVTSVSKRPERLADAPASIFVISSEDIRRSGATTLPEAMQLAPNLQVARSDARNYAITARGFNSVFENKLLVLIDGRTVYSPLFSGVFWDAQDVVLADVERIEVISGPGATLWGANAVNGVINVITKSAADTQGTLVSIGASSNEKQGVMRYGGAMNNGGHYRVYGKHAENDDTQRAGGRSTQTGWRRRQTGFRTDWGDGADGVTVQGDAYEGGLHQAGTADIRIAGANLVGHLNRKLDDDARLNLQAYWDYTQRDQPLAFVEKLHTFDLQLQYSKKMATSHDVVLGAGYRLALDRVRNDVAFAFLPGSKNLYWSNVFVQDEITLSEQLRLTAGLKLEDNNYTGLEFLPTLRLAWKQSDTVLLWGSASRSVRTPSRIDRDIFSPPNAPVVNGVQQFALNGGAHFESEVANVVELGYRAQPSSVFSYSATMFYSQFDRLRTLEPSPDGVGLAFHNGARGRSHGLETWGTWQAAPAWRVSAGGVVQRVSTFVKAGVVDTTAASNLATSDPNQYWMIRSSHDLAPGHELDLTVRHSGSLHQPSVAAYTALDVRYGWKIRPDLELSLVGQNLCEPSHPEFGAAPGRSEFDRSAYVTLLWRM